MERPNLVLKDTCTPEPYKTPNSGGGKSNPYPRDRARHSAKLKNELGAAIACESTKRENGEVTREGTYLSFRGPVNGELDFSSLEYLPSKIRLLNVKQEGNTDVATVFVPKSKTEHYEKAIAAYSDPSRDNEKSGNPAHNALMSSIEEVSLSTLQRFWTGRNDLLPGEEKAWVEAWLRYGDESPDDVKQSFIDLLEAEGIEYKKDPVIFPERLVMLVRANATDLSRLIDKSDYLAELCEGIEATAFLDDEGPADQALWINDLLERTTFESGSSVVCVLDSGVNGAHPLLKPMVADDALMSANSAWDTADHYDNGNGHGTGVAGLALYGNLSEKLVSTERYTVNHRLESVKLFEASNPTPEEFYAAVSQNAFSLAAAQHYEQNRIFCSAVTANEAELTDGSPTSWSAAIDSVISHPDDPEEAHELFLVSAGNVNTGMLSELGYPETNAIRSVRSPGQAWNALTVGAYSENAYLADDATRQMGDKPVAAHGELSPFSTTSLAWPKAAPVKPEIVLDGGNAVTDGQAYYSPSNLSPLSTGADISARPLRMFNGTSAAVSEAAWMAAEIENAYPDLWPETIRGLMVHSADWSEAMLDQFCPKGSEQDRQSTGRYRLLRMCGYGIPSLDKAIECGKNRVNLIIQDELTPFEHRMVNGKSVWGMKDMHLHHIPWPKDLLQQFSDVTARMRVTLSYYIEPCPGKRGWKNRYRYASHGLRFDVNKPAETKEEFAKRMNLAMRDESDGKGRKDSKGWFLGVNNRSAGSVFSDFKETQAIELSDIEYIAVYPIIGWWRELHSQDKANSKARYSLIVTIETPETEIDLYSAIKNKIEVASPIAIEVPR